MGDAERRVILELLVVDAADTRLVDEVVPGMAIGTRQPSCMVQHGFTVKDEQWFVRASATLEPDD